jgi:hypothetical protein
MRWLRLAAEQGYSRAQVILGVLYFKKDNIKSFIWGSLSLANENEESNSVAKESNSVAKELLDSLAKEMSASEISEAQRLVFDCQIKKYKGC